MTAPVAPQIVDPWSAPTPPAPQIVDPWATQPPPVARTDATANPAGTQKGPGFVSPTDALRLTADAGSFGLSKRVLAALESAANGKSYGDNFATEDSITRAAAKKSGALPAQLAGGLLPLLIPGVGPALDALGAVRGGAVLGAAGGVGHSPLLTGSDAPLTDQIDQTAKGAGIGALLGGVLGKLVPSFTGRTAAMLDAAAEHQVPLTAAQATNGPIARLIQGGLKVLPTGKVPLETFAAEKQNPALQDAAGRIASDIAGGAPLPASQEEAGKMIQNRAQAVLDQWQAEIPQRQRAVVDAIADVNPRGTIVPTEFRAAAKDIIARAKDPRNLNRGDFADAAAEAQGLLASIKKNGGVADADAALTLRSRLNQLAYAGADGVKRTSGSTRNFMNLVQGLDQDISNTIDASGADDAARSAWDDYNAHVRTARAGGGGRSGGESQIDLLENLVNGKPGDAYNAVTNTSNNSAAAQRMRALLGDDTYRGAAARHFLDLGNATAGQQDAEGSLFSPSTFLTNWNKAKSFRDQLYGDADPSKLRTFADMVGSIKKNALPNPSGTAGAIEGARLVREVVTSPVTAAAETYVALHSGHPPEVLAAELAAPYAAARTVSAQPLVKSLGAISRLGSSPQAVSLLDLIRRSAGIAAPAAVAGQQ